MKLFSLILLIINLDCGATFSTKRLFIVSEGHLKRLEENASVLFVVSTRQPLAVPSTALTYTNNLDLMATLHAQSYQHLSENL